MTENQTFFYNQNKLKMVKKDLAIRFGEILNESNFRFIFNSVIGPTVNIDNWMDEKKFLELLNGIEKADCALIELLVLGYSKPAVLIKEILQDEGIEFLVQSNIVYRNNDLLVSNGYIILPVNELYLIVSLPCNYKNGKAQFSDIYIGQDSMRLQQMLKNKYFDNILDLCTGSGVQGLHYNGLANKISAVELNDNAYVAASLNAMINGMKETYSIYKGDLYKALPTDINRYDCIISNPPYVPIPKNIEVAMCGDGGEDGMEIAKRIIDGYKDYLQIGGYAYMVLECIGDEEEPYIIDYIRKTMKKGVLNVSIIDKNSLLFQAHASAKLASYSDSKLYSFYFNKWKELFEKMEATAIYPVVIEYINQDCVWKENIVRRYENISLNSFFKIGENVNYCIEDKPYYNVYKQKNKIMSVRKDIFDTLLKNSGKRIIDFKFENEMDEKEYVCAMYELLKTVILFSEQDLLPKVMNSENDAQPYS